MANKEINKIVNSVVIENSVLEDEANKMLGLVDSTIKHLATVFGEDVYTFLKSNQLVIGETQTSTYTAHSRYIVNCTYTDNTVRELYTMFIYKIFWGIRLHVNLDKLDVKYLDTKENNDSNNKLLVDKVTPYFIPVVSFSTPVKINDQHNELLEDIKVLMKEAITAKRLRQAHLIYKYIKELDINKEDFSVYEIQEIESYIHSFFYRLEKMFKGDLSNVVCIEKITYKKTISEEDYKNRDIILIDNIKDRKYIAKLKYDSLFSIVSHLDSNDRLLEKLIKDLNEKESNFNNTTDKRSLITYLTYLIDSGNYHPSYERETLLNYIKSVLDKKTIKEKTNKVVENYAIETTLRGLLQRSTATDALVIENKVNIEDIEYLLEKYLGRDVEITIKIK